jgi:hypothetical protein
MQLSFIDEHIFDIIADIFGIRLRSFSENIDFVKLGNLFKKGFQERSQSNNKLVSLHIFGLVKFFLILQGRREVDVRANNYGM